ncbi:FCSD flavin-binding domain-containing protein [Halothiobacillus sp.]|uniref:FCSD flavin-binding domain-containing protein n=1 Tax=Halothiobacillus sp. TaxID=1891311 RepID=UPI0026047D8E|nr:FCSD flavin-binding domain-containing protein [Halothiobacillus sp.]MDD4966621.1 FCSD flavin-binding domain-containing protein [Halothiobacillus sp.]
MDTMNRRNFLKLTTAATAAAASFSAGTAFAKDAAHVVVIGGGVGGATFAKYMKMYSPETKVTIVEKNKEYQRPYGSSEVVVGRLDMKDITISYDALKNKHGVNFVFDTVTGVDYDTREVKTAGGTTLKYDRLLVSPGVSFDYSQIPGMDSPEAQSKIVHGWDAGDQLLTLQKQLEAVPVDGTVVLIPPPNPYRCPPGPYERSGLIAQWFINRGDKNAKVIILDPKNGFTVDVTMLQAWNRLYEFNLPESFKGYTAEERATFKKYDKPGKIQWIPAAEGGRVVKIDADNKTVECEAGVFKADMINLIPPLKAGKIALDMGLADKSGWCPVDQKTFESTIHPNVHVIGDACIAGQMPKSGYAANSQAKVAALQIKALLAGQEPIEPAYQNTCYALAGRDDYGMFVADFFRLKNGVITRDEFARYLPFNASDAQYRLSAVYLHAWMNSFTQDIFS